MSPPISPASHDLLATLLTPSPTVIAFLHSRLSPLLSLLPSSMHISALDHHWPAVIASVFFFTLLHRVVAARVSRSRALFGLWDVGRYYEALDTRQKEDWKSRVVSQMFVILILPYSIPLFWDERLNNDWVHGYSPRAGTVGGLSLGYFLWDLHLCLSHYSWFGPGFLLHAVSAVLVFLVGMKPFLMAFAPYVLIWETSTIFLNINYWLDKTGNSGTTLQAINATFLLASFFLTRCVGGVFIAAKMYYLFYTTTELPIAFAVVMSVANTLLTILQFYWFRKMVASVRKRFTKAQVQGREAWEKKRS